MNTSTGALLALFSTYFSIRLKVVPPYLKYPSQTSLMEHLKSLLLCQGGVPNLTSIQKNSRFLDPDSRRCSDVMTIPHTAEVVGSIPGPFESKTTVLNQLSVSTDYCPE